MKYKNRKGVILFILLALMLCLQAGCGRGAKEEITSLEQLNAPEKKVGVASDTTDDKIVEQIMPQAKIEYLKDMIAAYTAVSQGKLDGLVYDRRAMELAIENGQKGVRLLDENMGEGHRIAVGLSPVSKIPDLQGKINAFLDQIKEDGTLEDMQHRWLDAVDDTMPDIPVPEDPELTLIVGTFGAGVPYSYYKGTELTGRDVEMARRFAAYLNAELVLRTYDYDGLLAAAQSGDVDCIMANLYVTPERAEAIPFSEPYSIIEIGVMVRDHGHTQVSGEPEPEYSRFSSIKDSFYKTFIREDRWKLFVSGVGTTLLITVLAILLGTLLGFCLFMICRNGNPAANKITKFCVRLVQGLPVVVLLMIFYYIIFGWSNISGTAVSVIAFTLVFGAGVFGMIRSGVGAVDKGQLEAAYSLGYTNRRAFYRVILPQALPHFMPAYKGSVTEIIKATAIVGYVAVQDLTKMGDIVRSRTYEAFFPLIAVAAIYFLLAGVLTLIVNKIELRIDPRQRKDEDILKGVKS